MFAINYIAKSVEEESWRKYFVYKQFPSTIKNVNQRLWYPAFGHPTLLQLAVYSNHEVFFDWLITKSADVNISTEVWGTALHVAVKFRRLEFIERLLQAGADLYILASEANCTPIYHLLEQENEFSVSQWTKILRKLLKQGLNLDYVCVKPPMTPLEVAIKNNNTIAISTLLNYGASIEKVNRFNQTPLEVANSQESRELLVKHLIKLEAAGDCVSAINWKIMMSFPGYEMEYSKARKEYEDMEKLRDKNTGLFYSEIFSASDEEMSVFKRLSNSKVSLFNETVRNNFSIYSEILIQKVWISRFVSSPFFESRIKAEYLVLRKIVKSNPCINERLRIPEYGNPTLLQMAVFFGDEKFVDVLLKMKVDVNVVTDIWGTALHVAVMKNLKTIAEKLLKAKANVNIMGSIHNCTPIYLVLDKRPFPPRMIRLFIKYKLDINKNCVRTSSGLEMNPLEVAIVKDRRIVEEILLDFGADINHRGENNMTPLELVDSLKTIEKPWQVKNLLQKHIVKLIAAGMEVSEENRKSVSQFYDKFLDECRKEVEKMKPATVQGTNFSYYDALTHNKLQLQTAFKFGPVILDLCAIQKSFPIYCDLLVNKICFIKFRTVEEICREE